EPASRPHVLSRRRQWLFRLMAVGLSLAVAVLLVEVALRLLQQQDADGNLSLFGRPVGVIHPPVSRIRQTLQRYTTSSDSRMIYNPQTGWSARPGQCFHEGRYCYNSAGIRSAPREYPQTPPPDTLRIALFGDSFTHGDDVAWPATWAAQLEQTLREQGVSAEVINFGISASGMDQALLYWQSLGIHYQPDVVLLGFQSENVARNVNLLRGLYAAGSGIPFSKPRFILQADGILQAVNVPAAPPEQIPDILTAPRDWPLIGHEWFYQPPATCPLEKWSRLWQLCTGPSAVSDSRWSGRELFDPAGEPVQVTLAILAEFKRSTAAAGAGFAVVRLPRQEELARIMAEKPTFADALWTQVRQRHATVDPSPALVEAARMHGLRKLYLPHFSETAGAAIARSLATSTDILP
ncbi:MAG: SGNH/GDSL hydrolase family protein, partial [Planctomycetaceae bacterium]|nr:SGNH/GDSL hydrolase family protein [Planctomycetaceae bacterium]